MNKAPPRMARGRREVLTDVLLMLAEMPTYEDAIAVLDALRRLDSVNDIQAMFRVRAALDHAARPRGEGGCEVMATAPAYVLKLYGRIIDRIVGCIPRIGDCVRLLDGSEYRVRDVVHEIRPKSDSQIPLPPGYGCACTIVELESP